MEELIFTLCLAEIRRLSDAVCELDGVKQPRDVRLAELVGDCHRILIRALGDHAELVYAPEDEPEQVAA